MEPPQEEPCAWRPVLFCLATFSPIGLFSAYSDPQLLALTTDARALVLTKSPARVYTTSRGPSQWQVVDNSTGHVNNVSYIRYAESGRINWAQNYANYIDPKYRKEWSELWTPKGDGLILKSIKADFKFPMAWPDKISVYHKLRAAPTASTDSFLLDVLILSEKHQRAAARCVEDIVFYDYRRGTKTALRDFMVDKFQETFALQEATKERNTAVVRELQQRVQKLEKESWDRADAVEDMGTTFAGAAFSDRTNIGK